MTSKYQWPSKGRRAEAALTHAREKILTINTNDTSRLVKMAPRSFRRIRQGDDFRPVYHHGIPTTISHKSVIAAMHVIDRKAAARWQPQVQTAKACVLFGLSVKLFLANVAQVATELRHATLKAEGKWITHKAK